MLVSQHGGAVISTVQGQGLSLCLHALPVSAWVPGYSGFLSQDGWLDGWVDHLLNNTTTYKMCKTFAFANQTILLRIRFTVKL